MIGSQLRLITIAKRRNSESLVKYPIPGRLTLTHILQTELKSKVNAFQEGLQGEPAFPNGSPARRTIMGTSQITTQACDFPPEGADSHRGRRVSRGWGIPVSISGSIISESERSGWERAYPRICNKRTASGDNRPSKRIRPSTLAVVAPQCDSRF